MTPTKRELLALSGAVLMGLSGCLGDAPDTDPSTDRVDPDDDADAIEELVRGNTTFAFELFDELVAAEPEADHFLSPFSVSMALAMTWAGARGETEAEMAEALSFPFGQDDLHPAFEALDRELAERSEDDESNDESTEDADDEGDPFELNVANALWPDERFDVREEFLETAAEHYGAEPVQLNFAEAPEEARETINDWVAEETEDRIEELIPEDALDQYTALVLTNAIYFLAGWRHEFDEEATQDAEFTALDGSTGDVSMMTQSETFPYAEVDGHRLIELPYVGEETSMVVALPAEGEFEAFQDDLDADRLDELLAELERIHGVVELPRFEIESSYALPDALEALGMEAAFDSDASDFTGMIDRDDLHVDEVFHDAFVAVDEEGTEAAAATAVEMGIESAPRVEFELTVDRPFLFLIRDRPTDAVLFLGQVVDLPADPA